MVSVRLVDVLVHEGKVIGKPCLFAAALGAMKADTQSLSSHERREALEKSMVENIRSVWMWGCGGVKKMVQLVNPKNK